MSRAAALALALAALAPAAAQDFGQPTEERAAQESLPKSPDAIWGTLAAADVGIDQANGLFTIRTTPAIDALAGKPLKVSGFMLPLDEAAKTTHFLLTRNTPVCAFCPPGEPDEVIEVTSAEGVAPSSDLISVEGMFELIDNGDQGLFFQLKDARLAAPPG